MTETVERLMGQLALLSQADRTSWLTSLSSRWTRGRIETRSLRGMLS